MLFEVLGCHGGSVPHRRLPSFLINGHLLLEAGSVTSALPLGAQAGIEHVLLSHAHLDHTVGLAFLVDNTQSAQTATGRTVSVTAASIAPELYPAVYACVGYRNEVMTLKGYGSLLSKVNVPEPHPVLDPLLRNLMSEEGHHARFYRRIAEGYLRSSPRARRAARLAMNKWWGIVGENFAGSEGADRVILYLFRDERGRELADKVDAAVASLPGLEGVRPMRRRLEQALRRARRAG